MRIPQQYLPTSSQSNNPLSCSQNADLPNPPSSDPIPGFGQTKPVPTHPTQDIPESDHGVAFIPLLHHSSIFIFTLLVPHPTPTLAIRPRVNTLRQLLPSNPERLQAFRLHVCIDI